MVNYCCVTGCRQNSRQNKNLNFYSLPREKKRQEQWLIAAGKQDLLNTDSDKLRKNLRFCSRHFKPSSVVFKHLKSNAVPSEKLPGCFDELDTATAVHDGVICDVCEATIEGFRYKCVSCDNFDLCQKCEMLQSHGDHYMLRIPHRLKFKLADELLDKWRDLLSENHLTHDDGIQCKTEAMSSDDDEPITKYITNHTFDLSEDVKKVIQKEVVKAIKYVKKGKFKSRELKKTEVKNGGDIESSDDKVMKTIQVVPPTQELAFADVTTMKPESVTGMKPESMSSMKPESHTDVKSEYTLTELTVANLPNDTAQLQPVIYLKINDVLTTLVIAPGTEISSASGT